MIFVSRWKFNAAMQHIHKHLIGMEVRMAEDVKALDAKLDELAVADAARQTAIKKELDQLAAAVATQAPDLTPQVAKVQALIDSAGADKASLDVDDPAPTP